MFKTKKLISFSFLVLLVFGSLFGLTGTVKALDEVNYSGINTGLHDDDVVGGPYSFGFDFEYYGHTYTGGYPSTNGNVALSNGDQYYWVNESLDNGGTWSNTIYPFWDDLITRNFEDATVYYTTIGTAPHRQFVVQWTNMYFYEHPELPMGTFQMILDEGTNVIHFQYRDLLGGSLSLGESATIGIKGNDNTELSQVSFNTASLTQGQAITFTPNGSTYDVDANAAYLPIYVLPLGVPASPLPINPIDALTDAINTPTFEWGSVDLATSYSLLISEQPDFSTTIVNNTGLTETTYTLGSPLTYNTTYYWKIQAVNAVGGSYSTTRSFTTAAQSFPPPNTPTHLTGSSLFAGGRVKAATLLSTAIKMKLTDPDTTQQVRYRLQIATNADFSDVAIDYRSTYTDEGNFETFTFGMNTGTYLAGTSATVLSDGQDYYIRMAAEDQHAQSSDWAGPVGRAFTYDITPPATLGAPTLVGSAATASTTLVWTASNDSNPANPTYMLQYATDPAFSTYTTVNTNDITTTIVGLGATTYYARVLAVDTAGNVSSPSLSLDIVVPVAVAPATTTTSTVPAAAPTSTAAPVRATTAASSSLAPDASVATSSVAGPNLVVHIVDKNNNPIKGALVTLHSVVRTAYTDSQGNATFTDVPAGAHHVDAEYNNMRARTAVTIATASLTASTRETSSVYLKLKEIAVIKHDVGFSVSVWLSVGGAFLIVTSAAFVTIVKKRRLQRSS